MVYRKVLLKIPAVLIITAIWLFSSQSILPKPRGILGFDKFQHLTAYFILAGALGLWFSPEQWKFRARKTLLAVFLCTALYGIIDEAHQYFVPGRDCNVWDWLADAAGAAAGAAA
ncbi:MAG: VanZ family protein, partial [Treponema sp.]|nr:VanZ family protein [Treponema sp.]